MNNKKTLLYVGGFELPDKNAAAHRVLNVAKIYRELGWNVVFVGISHEQDTKVPVLETKTEIQGFKCYSLPYPKNRKDWVSYLTSSQKYIEVIKSLTSVNAIMFYNFQAVAMSRLMKYCKRKGIKCYSDVTEWYSAQGQGLAYYVLKGLDTWYRMRILHKKQDGIIAISRYLEKYYKKNVKTIYIPALTDKSEEKWQTRYQKSSDELKLVYAGSPALKDRIDTLIEAIPMIKRKLHLDIVGISKEQYLSLHPEHKDTIQKCNNIYFHGRKPHLETLDFVKKANYSCFFRDVDRVSMAGFSTKFAEAISCGTPVITNNTSNLIEYADGHKNGILINDLSVSTILKVLNTVEGSLDVNNDLFDYHSYITKFSTFLNEV